MLEPLAERSRDEQITQHNPPAMARRHVLLPVKSLRWLFVLFSFVIMIFFIRFRVSLFVIAKKRSFGFLSRELAVFLMPWPGEPRLSNPTLEEGVEIRFEQKSFCS